VIVTVGLLTIAFGWLWRVNTEQVRPMREIIIRDENDERDPRPEHGAAERACPARASSSTCR
jgi:hypothetical protein